MEDSKKEGVGLIRVEEGEGSILPKDGTDSIEIDPQRASVKEEPLKEEERLKDDTGSRQTGQEKIDGSATTAHGKESGPLIDGMPTRKADSRDGKSSAKSEGPIVTQQGHDLLGTPANADDANKLDELQACTSNQGGHTTASSPTPRPGSNFQGIAPLPSEVDPLILQRAPANRQRNSRPGAYMGAPGADLQRNTTLNYDLVGANAEHGGPVPLVVRPHTGTQNNQLAVANLVADDSEANANLGHANPVDLEAQEKKQQAAKKQQQTILFIFVLLIIAAAAIIGTVAGTRNKQDGSATATPTSYGSMTPSEVPSSAPTGALDVLLSSVPDYTLASINNGSDTPQWKAWNWLSNHQNITFLPEWRKEQLFAMATFFYAFDGENWYKPLRDRWMDDTLDECRWYSAGYGGIGVFGEYNDLPPDSQVPSCDDQGKLTSLHLIFPPFTRVSLNLPPEITMLTTLSNLFFIATNSAKTSLTEMLPKELYKLPTLESLVLVAVDQDDMGVIPTELGLITSLQSLALPSVSGPLSSELCMLTQLKGFRVPTSLISGTIPSEIGLWTSLESFAIGSSWLSGTIPCEVGNMRNLTYLTLQQTQLTGTIPTELGRATDLRSMSLNLNALSGNVPSEIGTLTSLFRIELEGNLLTGTLLELSMVKSLIYLYLSFNDLTGPIPSEYGELQELSFLNMNGLPLLTGTIPSELGRLTNLVYANISGNPLLSGTLPEQWCYLQNESCAHPVSAFRCSLHFDCSDRLCGCDCPCTMNTTSR